VPGVARVVSKGISRAQAGEESHGSGLAHAGKGGEMMRSGSVLALALVVGPSLVQGQEEGATGSQPSLMFGVAATFTTSTSLWTVPNQPLQLGAPPADSLDLTRAIDGGLGLMFYGMYFPKKSLGFSGEIFFLGTQYEDECKLAFTTGSPSTNTACLDIDGRSRSTATVLATVGAVLRASPRGAISPYVRLALGAAIINRNSIAMSGQTGGGVVVIYPDEDARSVSPAAVLGLGFTAGTKRGGYQVRLEVRDNIIGYDAVTGPSARAGLLPPTQASYDHFFTFLIGFEIVLEKSRGRRY